MLIRVVLNYRLQRLQKGFGQQQLTFCNRPHIHTTVYINPLPTFQQYEKIDFNPIYRNNNLVTLCFLITKKDITIYILTLTIEMDITLDFTQQPQPKLSQLTQHPYLRSITFVLPFFKQSEHNFKCLWQYISFLNDKPLVKIFVKPKGQHIQPKYETVAVGGTFDHLHIGHQVLLLQAVLSAEKKLIIGVTSQKMLQSKLNKELVQSLLMRINQVREFIRTIKPNIQLQFVQLQDPYGPTIERENIDAITVSSETYKMAEFINQKRKQKGFHPLVIENCPIMAPFHHLTSIKEIQNKISSTQIRAHILAKNGFTIEKFAQYQEIWMKMVSRINSITGKQEMKNHLICRKWWDIVVKYFSQYWRFYHTNHHNATLFRQLKETPQMGFEKLSQIDKIALEVSIFFHDIIYRPDLKTNEENSAHFALAFLYQIWGEGHEEEKKEVADKVRSAILATKSHKPSNQIQQILCDLDMSILDSPLQKYQTYAFNVERQYRPLYKQYYGKQRVQFLTRTAGQYKFTWRKGENVERNIKWQIEHWTMEQLKQ